MPAKPYVQLEHRRFSDRARFFAALERRVPRRRRFHRRRRVRSGRNLFEHGALRRLRAWVSDYSFEHIYYRSIRDRESDYLTARDFIGRWDTDWFWCSKNVGAQVSWIRRLTAGSAWAQHLSAPHARERSMGA